MQENVLTNRRRPVGITILAVLLAIGGVLELIGGIVLLGSNATTGVIDIILGAVTLVLVWGLWTLQQWAFWGIVALEVVNLIYDIYLITQGSTATIVSAVIALIILIYLFADRNVRAAFRA